MSLTDILDLVLLVLILLAAWRGFSRGLTGFVLDLLALFLGGVAAWALYIPAACLVPIDSELVRRGVACVLVFLAATIIAGCVLRKARSALPSMLRMLDRVLGVLAMEILLWLALAFVFNVLENFPPMQAAFQQSVLTPVIARTSRVVKILAPDIASFVSPDTEVASQALLYNDLQITVSSEWTTRGTVCRTIRVTGNARLPSIREPGLFLPAGKDWTITEYPAGPGKVTVEARGELPVPDRLSWGMSRLHWSQEGRVFRSSFTEVVEVFDLREALPATDPGEPTPTAPAPNTDQWQKLLEEARGLQHDVAGRMGQRAAEKIAVPVHVSFRFPYPIASADGPGMEILRETAVWDFDLHAHQKVVLRAKALRRGWGGWIGWSILVVGGGLGAVWFVSQHISWSSPDDGDGPSALNSLFGSMSGTPGGSPETPSLFED